VVAEEHLHSGALGSAVAAVVGAKQPVPIEFVDVGDHYAESGTPEELMRQYGLTASDVARAAKRALERKRL
jgi:transketolase